jgi:hypothetical protein
MKREATSAHSAPQKGLSCTLKKGLKPKVSSSLPSFLEAAITSSYSSFRVPA